MIVSVETMQAIQRSGAAVMRLTRDVTGTELLASPPVRSQVVPELHRMAMLMQNIGPDCVAVMSTIDWARWRAVAVSLRQQGGAQDDALLYGVSRLVPDTLAQLAAYRLEHPELFAAVA